MRDHILYIHSLEQENSYFKKTPIKPNVGILFSGKKQNKMKKKKNDINK